ncbi:MAG: hypothetical protein Ct9H90mP14_3590 [Methanobacteriota archaeon]|nr:MAG: hypothetical protein Ct9H90mP14_3590 [Euryarchaeota archaeon]
MTPVKKREQNNPKKPPNLLVTTPETAQIMLLGSRLREHLAGVKAVILDEVHVLGPLVREEHNF